MFFSVLDSIQIKPPFSVWIQISSFSFFLAGNFSDLLIIRICLSSAYIFLLTNSVLGAPLWPILDPGTLQLDGVLWACLNLYVHLSTVVRLFLDERQVPLEPKKEALWRLFYRIGGLSQKMFRETIANHCEVVTIPMGQEIPTDKYFYIIYQGTVKLRITDTKTGKVVGSRCLGSAQIFDFRALGLLQHNRHLESHQLYALAVYSDVTVFRFPGAKMSQIAANPATRLLWKELLMENLLRIVQRYFDRRPAAERMNDDVVFISPMYRELSKWEEPESLRAGSGKALQRPIQHILASMSWSFTPPWPIKGFPMGLRHKLPAPGRVRTVPPKSLLDSRESQALLEESVGSSTGYASLSSADEEEAFLDHLDEIDEELGGMHLVAFK